MSTTVNFTQVELQKLITHHVGNKTREESFALSTESTSIDSSTQEFLLNYFLSPLKAEEFYSFSHPVKVELNDIYLIVQTIFTKPDTFIALSQSIAKLLYEQSIHPKIKEGELNIAYLTNVVLEDEVVEAIGIFKSESSVPFLKMNTEQTKFSIHHDYGFEIKGVDKGCIIFNTDQDMGYRIAIIDNTNKSTEAQYWKDNFLQLKPICNDYHQTNQFLGITKNFVTNQIAEEFEITKADKIDLLNRSVEYFKTHESFDKSEFENEVFQNTGIIKSFQNFDETYRQNNEIQLADTFEISPQAVKKQTRIFKSVLKLDKNFHVYIHGNRDLIEQGMESDGRKFYKLYFKEEN